jgi:glycosyltransferase involved in cell wall biosynthesis
MIDRLYPGGTESQLVALIRNLDRRRVRPSLCLLDGEDPVSRSMEPADCPVLRLGVRSLRRPQTIGKAWELARFLRRLRVDVLQVYFPDSTYLGVPVGRLAGVPYVLRTRNNLNHWMSTTHRRLGRLLNRVVTGTLTNSEACRRAVLADEAPPPGSVLVLEGGVDLGPFLELPPASRANATRRVGLVANLRRVKGVDVFVKAAALLCGEHPDVHFVVAGEGPERPGLEAEVARLGLTDRFELAGTVPDIPGFLGSLDVAVLSSRAEGMPNALLEYMAAARAVVATAVGGAVELIEDGTHGVLVEPERPDLIARGVSRLLHQPSFAARLGAAARHRVRKRYSREAMVAAYEAFYHRLMAEGRFLAN